MSHPLQFNKLSLDLEPSGACWSLEHGRGGKLSGMRAGLVYHQGGRQFHHIPESWQILEEDHTDSVAQARVAWVTPATGDQGPLQIQLIFQIDGERHPMLRWQMQVSNQGSQPATIDTLELMSGGLDGQEWIAPAFEEPAFYSNGWQSWSYTGTYRPYERARRSRLGPLSGPMLADPADPHPKRPGHFTSDMFGVLGCRHTRQGILAGFLSQQQQFGYVECLFDPLSFNSRKSTRTTALAPVLRLCAAGDGVRLAPGDQMTSDWACLQFVEVDAERPLDPYLSAVADLHGLDERGRRRSLPPAVSPPDNGWCSWYHYYQNITAENLRANLETAAALQPDLRLDLFQIDDGFQTLVGDWFTFRAGFPGGVAPLAAEIRQAGFMPGLWLAPFILQPSSDTARKHPEWLLRDRRGRPVNAGFGWDSLTNALDLTHPEALAYAAKAVGSAAHEWGFDFIKLDFLYAGALAGQHHIPGKTRAQILRQGLQALRDAAGEQAILLGCGCPLGPAIGLVDVMRIGPDVDQRWEPSFLPVRKVSRRLNHALFNPETNMPSARNAIHNVLTRLPLHQRWWINDPDCLVLRDSSELTLPEVQSLATAIFLSGGQFLLSDDLTSLTSERLRIAQAMLPLLPKAARAEDWLEASPPKRLRLDLSGPVGAWHLLALFNWEDIPVSRSFQAGDEQNASSPEAPWFARDFWSGEIIASGQKPASIDIPAHGVRLFAVRQANPAEPTYLGSDLHMSQGMEVSQWDYTGPEGGLRMALRPASSLRGHIALYLPETFQQRAHGKVRVHGPDGSVPPFSQNGLYLTIQADLQSGSPAEFSVQPDKG